MFILNLFSKNLIYMNNLDLDINNYTLDDLLNLFKLDYNFEKVHLKKAKNITLRTHPDKSGLDKKYFLFFMEAYEMLEKIFYFRIKRKVTVRENYKITESDKHILDSLKNKSIPEFNKWFNKLFDKVKVYDTELDGGYNSWYKNGENKEMENVKLSDFGEVFERKRLEAKMSIVKKNDLETLDSGSSGYNLDRKLPDNYTSGIFSKLQYEDLKKAHTETVMPVTMRDMPVIDKTTEYQNKKFIEPMTALEIQKFNEANKYNNGKNDMKRAYSLIKNDIKMEESNNKWWGYLKQLEK